MLVPLLTPGGPPCGAGHLGLCDLELPSVLAVSFSVTFEVRVFIFPGSDPRSLLVRPDLVSVTQDTLGPPALELHGCTLFSAPEAPGRAAPGRSAQQRALRVRSSPPQPRDCRRWETPWRHIPSLDKLLEGGGRAAWRTPLASHHSCLALEGALGRPQGLSHHECRGEATGGIGLMALVAFWFLECDGTGRDMASPFSATSHSPAWATGSFTAGDSGRSQGLCSPGPATHSLGRVSVCLPIYPPSVCPPLCPPMHSSVHLSIHPTTHSTRPPICPFIHLSARVRLSIYHSVLLWNRHSVIPCVMRTCTANVALPHTCRCRSAPTRK